MTQAARSQSSSPLQDALAWLHVKPADDPLRDLAPLLRSLREAAEAAPLPAQRLRVLELFQVRAAALTEALKPHLLDATLPLLQRLRAIAQGLIDVHGTLAALTLRVMLDLGSASSPGFEERLPQLCAGVLTNLAEQQQAALLVAGPSPVSLWSQVQTVFQLMRGLQGQSDVAERRLQAMLALAACQPETFTARELAFLAGYLDQFSSAVAMRSAPTPPAELWYWLEDGRDLPPVALARRAPPPGRTVFFYSCADLGRQARSHAEAQPGASGYHPPDEFRMTLGQAADRWSAPPRRRSHRRPVHFRVDICASLADLRQLLGSASGVASPGSPPATTQWMVLNESPGGFGMMHVSGTLGRLAAGDAIGMRMPTEPGWTICLIRWARSDNPEHVELGVEMVAPHAAPVSLATSPAAAGVGLIGGLLLPPLPALHRNETLLTPRGCYGLPAFTLVREMDGKLQLTECRPERLVLQTAGVEVFEFCRDFTAN